MDSKVRFIGREERALKPKMFRLPIFFWKIPETAACL